MKTTIFILVFILCLSCKNEIQTIDLKTFENKKEVLIDSVELEKKNTNINNKEIFNQQPLSIKEYTLNDQNYWVTSGIVDKKYLDSFISYKGYHLKRGYNFSNKRNQSLVSNLDVYVTDDAYKMSRKEANEELMSISTNDSSFVFWNEIRVGMHKDSLRKIISVFEYHEDIGLFKLYSDVFKSDFYFKENFIDSIVISKLNNFEKSAP